MKVQVREALKNFFCHQKSNKKADKLYEIFFNFQYSPWAGA